MGMEVTAAPGTCCNRVCVLMAGTPSSSIWSLFLPPHLAWATSWRGSWGGRSGSPRIQSTHSITSAVFSWRNRVTCPAQMKDWLTSRREFFRTCGVPPGSAVARVSGAGWRRAGRLGRRLTPTPKQQAFVWGFLLFSPHGYNLETGRLDSNPRGF